MLNREQIRKNCGNMGAPWETLLLNLVRVSIQRHIRELKHARFLSHGRQPEVCCFPV